MPAWRMPQRRDRPAWTGLLTERPKARRARKRLKVTKKMLRPQPDLQKKTKRGKQKEEQQKKEKKVKKSEKKKKKKLEEEKEKKKRDE